jgi:hypothetical protein
LLSVAADRQVELAANRRRRDDARQIMRRPDLVAVGGNDHVALLYPRLIRRAALANRRDQSTRRMVRVEAEALRDRRGDVLNRNAKPSPGDVTVILELVDDILGDDEGTANPIPTDPPEGE